MVEVVPRRRRRLQDQTEAGIKILGLVLALVGNVRRVVNHHVEALVSKWHLPVVGHHRRPVSLSDILLALGILLLLLEVIKGARPGAKYLTDHLLSLIVFGAAAAEFLLWPRFGTSTYFLLAMLALVDFLSGIALRARRGVQVASGPAVSSRGRRKVAVATAEPQFDPAPAPSAAASAAESVRFDHPDAKAVHAEVTPAAPSPEVSSPGLQPGEGAPPSPDPRPR